MQLTGKQKSQILISLLEENSSAVLNELSEKSSKALSDSLEDVPELDSKEQSKFLDDILSSVNAISFESSSDEMDLSGSSDLDDINLEDNDIDESQEQEQSQEPAAPKYPENYRKVEVIAQKLSEQSIQMIAFFFAQIEDPLKTDLEEVIDQGIIEDIKHVDIEMVPISKKVFEKLFEFIVIKAENEEDTDSEDQSADTDSFDF